MRVLQINSHYNQGGAARIAACIHKQLLKEGQESYVAYGRGEQLTDIHVYRFNNVPEVYISALFSRITGLNGWGNKIATRRLIRFIEVVNPDVIHMHALHGYYLNFNMLFRYIKKKQIPCVWTFHDCHAFVGNCGYFFDCRRWQEGCGNCPYVHNYPKSQFFDFTKYMWKKKKELFTSVDNLVVVTPTNWLTEEAKLSYMGKYPCVTVRNGIDTTDTFYPRDKMKCREKYGYSPEDKIVLGIAVGYSDPRKGAKYIIEMAQKLKDDVKVVLIGWESCNDDMILGIDNIVALPPTYDTNQLAEYYSMADVFVLPSLAENYPTVTLEALACGTPAVGFDAGGIPEQLTEGKGIVVETGNGEAFTNAVKQALDRSLFMKRDELSACIHAENSVAKMTEEYMQIYQELMRNKE